MTAPRRRKLTGGQLGLVVAVDLAALLALLALVWLGWSWRAALLVALVPLVTIGLPAALIRLDERRGRDWRVVHGTLDP